MIKSLIKPLIISLAIVVGFAVAGRVVGDECPGPYGGAYGGGCPRGEIIVDKLVWNPNATKGGEGEFVDNLGTSDHKFTASQEVSFRVTVKNVSSVLLDKIEVVDTLPVELEYVSSPGSYNPDSREIRWEVKDLEANASRDFEIKAKVKKADKLPENRSLFCVVNRVEGRIPEDTDSDTSQLCIEKPIVEKLPEAGPIDSLLVLGGSGVLGVLGLALVKRSKAMLKA